jgi:hypothetical protein
VTAITSLVKLFILLSTSHTSSSSHNTSSCSSRRESPLRDVSLLLSTLALIPEQ